MSDAIVTAERLGKCYQIEHQRQRQRYVALRDVLADKLSAPLRWFTGAVQGASAQREDFWALRDVSFAIAPGEVVGVIGRNGAGKSTLLKVLSRITEPTEGVVTLDGRVGSLLEVGTGFHPELTGRENIFLNGAILGMTRVEIARRFDAIVAFAEVDRFLDTPVKRYSSGMYVRLAFAIAAHIEPEILIVDEVLAVGDVEFQKKSLGKMHDASRSGRTVLFVSHNMAAIKSLTTRCILLEAGRVAFDGPTAEAIERYLTLGHRVTAATRTFGRGTHTAIISAQLVNANGSPSARYTPGEPLRLEVSFDTDGVSGLSMEAFLVDSGRQKLALASLHQFHGVTLPEKAGRYRTTLDLTALWLASGNYTVDLAISVVNSDWDHYVQDAIDFEVIGSNPGGGAFDFQQSLGYGAFAMPCLSPPVFSAESRGETHQP